MFCIKNGYVRLSANHCRGDIIEQMEPATTNESLPLLDQAVSGIILSSTGPQILVYFYTDLAAEADGFEIDYW